MSSVPPNSIASALQSHVMQRQVSALRDSEQSAKTNARFQQDSAIDEKDTTVGTADGDTQVHTDAEGTGSQGRAFSNPEEQDEQQENAPAPFDDEGRNIDFQA